MIVKEIVVTEGELFSWRGFWYYWKHKDELTKDSLAKALTTRDDTGFSSSSIYRTIRSILDGAYTVERNGEVLEEVTPLTKLQEGDVITTLSFMCLRYYKYDGKVMKYWKED